MIEKSVLILVGLILGAAIALAVMAQRRVDAEHSTKEQLQRFYAEGAVLTQERSIKSDADVTKYAGDINAWKDHVGDWMDKNMAPGAKARFLDITPYLNARYFVYSGTFNDTHNWLINYTGYLRRNLIAMIESGTWDKQ
jgi:hypothetical protein